MFEGWEDFYLLIGSAAAALIGLLFVVVTLTAGIEARRAVRGEQLFMTPTLFNMGVVFVMSAAAMAPHAYPWAVSAIAFGAAIAGMVYMIDTITALDKPSATEHWTDIWFYACAPLACFAALAGVSISIAVKNEFAPELLAGLLTTLLLVAIRNAWDLVTWLAPRVEQYKDPNSP